MSDQVLLYSLDEFEQYIALPEHHDRRFELIDGEIVEKAMPTQEHAAVAGNAVTHINIHLLQHDIDGTAFVEARYRPAGDARNDRLPDVSYVAGSDKPLARRGAAEFMPDLAIEVQSPDDSLKAMLARADFYLANGVRMVSLIYPSKKLVEVLTADERLLLDEDDTLDADAVLPGFSLPVRALFRGI